MLYQPVGQPAKCSAKRLLEFDNNAVGHMTSAWRPTCLLGLLFMCCIHVFVLYYVISVGFIKIDIYCCDIVTLLFMFGNYNISVSD